MCIIMSKPAGVKMPPLSEIEKCMQSNPDGFGVMYSDGKKVRVFKTMKSEEMKRWWKKIMSIRGCERLSIIFHARIKTHGTVNINNCHPWVNDDGIGFAHNGVLSLKNRADMTDSETFFRDIWTPVYKYGGEDAADLAVKACIGTSRFAFLYPDGRQILYGSWEKGSVEGIQYSNGSWQTKKYNHFTTGCAGGYGSGYDYGYNSFYDDFWGYVPGYNKISDEEFTQRTLVFLKSKKFRPNMTWFDMLKKMWDEKATRSYTYSRYNLSFEKSLRLFKGMRVPFEKMFNISNAYFIPNWSEIRSLQTELNAEVYK